MKIEYHYETAYALPQPGKHTDWIIEVAHNRGFEVHHLNYIFCEDDYLLDMNRRFLNHDYYTDILTFSSENNIGLTGDIFISVDRVRENAGLYDVPFEEEMRRVIIHGALHLMGYDDKNESEMEAMRREENTALQLFHVKHS